MSSPAAVCPQTCSWPPVTCTTVVQCPQWCHFFWVFSPPIGPISSVISCPWLSGHQIPLGLKPNWKEIVLPWGSFQVSLHTQQKVPPFSLRLTQESQVYRESRWGPFGGKPHQMLRSTPATGGQPALRTEIRQVPSISPHTLLWGGYTFPRTNRLLFLKGQG